MYGDCVLHLLSQEAAYQEAIQNSFTPPQVNLCSADAGTAYNDALALLTETYAFTEWKGINWQAVANAGLADAQSGNIQLAIQKVVGMIPDGHVYMDHTPEHMIKISYENTTV